jgi:hypothetical protein
MDADPGCAGREVEAVERADLAAATRHHAIGIDFGRKCSAPSPDVAVLVEALRVAKRTLIEGGGGGVTCTVWVPDDVCPSETLVDHIDAALAAWGQANG